MIIISRLYYQIILAFKTTSINYKTNKELLKQSNGISFLILDNENILISKLCENTRIHILSIKICT